MNVKQLNNAAGFTLVEILVALTIFTFAVLGLAVGTVTITRTNNNSHLNAAAINLAQAKLEELRAMKNTVFTALSCAKLFDLGMFGYPGGFRQDVYPKLDDHGELSSRRYE